jgi:glycosyltransferase involved in cell wall biosynthesis
MPTLSVVVPNYNHARYLESALRAHLGQSLPPLEVIVVDDASTDESVAIVERLAMEDPRLRLIRLARNGGVNAAMNRGLSEARGDCVCFSAADDLVTREFAARSLETLARYPVAAFCFSDPAELVGDMGRVQPLPLYLSDRPCLLPPDEIERLLKSRFFAFPGQSVLYRRAALVALGGFVEDLYWSADWFTNCVLAFRHGACYVPEVLVFFRVSSSSYSAVGGRDAAVQRRLVARVLGLLASAAYRDVAPAFRASALVPEFRFRVLFWLLASARHHRYVTPRLVMRLLVRGAWWVLKPYMHRTVRPAGRRLARQWARLSAAARGETQ